MANTKKKKMKTTKRKAPAPLTKDRISELRYQQGGFAVTREISQYNEEDIIILSYINTENEKAKKLTRMYDQMLLHAKLEPEEYIQQRTKMLRQIGDYIVQHNLYQVWIDLILIVTDNIRSEKILHAYMNEMMDTWQELSLRHGNDQLICGITSEGELLFKNNYFGDWDLPALQLRANFENGDIPPEEAVKFLEKHKDLDEIAKNENLWSIEMIDMMPFINERTYKITTPSPPQDYSYRTWSLPPKWRGTQNYKDAISRRKYMIGRKGIRVKLINASDVDELFFMEDIDRNNELVMLYQFTIKNKGSFSGYYRAKSQSFFSAFLRTTHMGLHQEIENFVLGVYATIVAELDKNRMHSRRIEEVSSLDDIPDYLPTRIYYQFVASERDGYSMEKTGARTQRPHLRSFALRKLKDTHEASEEARQRAMEYGIELQDGYTFVRSYSVGRTEHKEV